jgi:hypothetical protein
MKARFQRYVRTVGLTHTLLEREINGVPLWSPRQSSILCAIERDGLSTVDDRPPLPPFYRREERLPAQLGQKRLVAVPHRPDSEEYCPPTTIGAFYEIHVTRLPYQWMIPIVHHRIDYDRILPGVSVVVVVVVVAVVVVVGALACPRGRTHFPRTKRPCLAPTDPLLVLHLGTPFRREEIVPPILLEDMGPFRDLVPHFASPQQG